MKYRKVLVLKSTSGEGGEPLFAGWTVKLPSDVAALLVGTQQASYVASDTPENREGRAETIDEVLDSDDEGDEGDENGDES